MKRITLLISTGDGVVGYGAVFLYWRRCGTDGVIYRNVHHYWGRCGREWGNRSLLGTQLWGMVL